MKTPYNAAKPLSFNICLALFVIDWADMRLLLLRRIHLIMADITSAAWICPKAVNKPKQYSVSSQRQEVINRKMEAAKQAAWTEATLVIDDLKAAVTDANQQLCKERAARDQLEEDMKQSFMRSVCAINLEVSYCNCLCVQPAALPL